MKKMMIKSSVLTAGGIIGKIAGCEWSVRLIGKGKRTAFPLPPVQIFSEIPIG
jgi:hypothetical protein